VHSRPIDCFGQGAHRTLPTKNTLGIKELRPEKEKHKLIRCWWTEFYFHHEKEGV